MRLLVVEDDLPLAESLVTLLTSSGYAVDCVHDGASAEALVAVEQFDLVILDLNLPQMDGLLAAAKLVLVWLLVLLSGAVVSQLIARAARRQDGNS